MSIAATLYHLQQLDSDIDAIRRRVFEIDQHARGTPALLHTREQLAIVGAARAEAEKIAGTTEGEIQALVAKLEAEDKRLYTGSIKNPKEMVEVQEEVESLKRRRTTLEDRLLVELEALEARRDEESRCRVALREAETHHAADAAGMKVERQQIVARVVGHAEQRKALTSALPKSALNQYELLRTKQANGLAVTLLRNGACGACGEQVSSSHAQQANTGNNLVNCSNCGRILYAM
jgi:predicted  nucleic acid-binding Zn-ribbon protein